MNDEADEALVKYATEVKNLLELYRAANDNPSVEAMSAFNLQFIVVEALTSVAVLPVIRVPSSDPGYPLLPPDYWHREDSKP